MRPIARLALAALSLCGTLALASPASARTSDTLPWTFPQVYRATIRLVRVDLGCEITERDEDAGYLTFDYVSSGRAHHGSVEIIGEPGSDGVRVIVQIPTMPTYVERMVLDRLTRKLRDEVGEPPSRRPTVREEPRERPVEPPADDPPAEEAPTHDASGDVPPGPYW